MSDLLQLAERCERATGPDRRLDTLIEIEREPAKPWIVDLKPGRFPQEPIYGTFADLRDWANDETVEPPEISAPRYTASLDAAMTLVPEGWHWECGIFNLDGKARARTAEQVETEFGTAIGIRTAVTAATPALALCAAALRAQAASKEQQEKVK